MDPQGDRDCLRESLVGGTTSSSSSSVAAATALRSPDDLDACAEPQGLEKEYLNQVARRNIAIMVTCTTCMFMLYGYDFGITAWSVLLIKTRGADEISDIYVYLAMHGEALGMLVACAPLGGLIEGLIGSKVLPIGRRKEASHKNGRKSEIKFVNLVAIVGASLEGLAGIKEWDTIVYVAVFVLGRFMYGLGLGLSLRCGPMYLRETVAEAYRNAAMVSVKLSMVVAVIISYILGGLLPNPMLGYFGVYIMAGISLMCLHVVPESPMFMLLHPNKFPKAQVLDALKFTNPAATEDDVADLQKEILTEVLSYTPGHPSFGKGHDLAADGPKGGRVSGVSVDSDSVPATGLLDIPPPRGAARADSGYGYLDNSQKRGAIAMSVKNLPSVTKAPGMLAALVLTAGLMVAEQACGMTAILYYGGVFLADIDLISVDWGLAVLGVLQLVVAVMMMYALDPVGRKPLLFFGLGGLLVSSLLLVIGGFAGLTGAGRWWGLVGLYAFTASYSVSLGALVWVLVSEVFPTCHRAQAISIVSTAHFGTSAVFVILLPLVLDIGGYAAMFTCFFLVVVVANVFAHRFMVETRGLTATQIQSALTAKAGFATHTEAPPPVYV